MNFNGAHWKFKKVNDTTLDENAPEKTLELLYNPDWFKVHLPNAEFTDHSLSPCGRYVAYGFRLAGSDWTRIRVYDVKKKRVLGDELNWIKMYHVVWLPDGDGFLYSRFAAPASGNFSGFETEKNHYHTLRYHRVGTAEEQDIILYQLKGLPYHTVQIDLTGGGRYLKIVVDEAKNDAFGFIDVSKLGERWFTRPLPEPTWLNDRLKFNSHVDCFHNNDTNSWFLCSTTIGCKDVRRRYVWINFEKPNV